jgi:hypothetical protein
MKSAVAPMSVWAEYGRVWTGFVARSIKTAGDIKTGKAFKINFFDTVIFENLATMDDAFQGSLGGEWPDSLGDQQALSDLDLASPPVLPSFVFPEREITV